MLVLDIFQNHKGDIAVQYNPKKLESIGRLREGLGNYMIENPLVTFSKRYKISFYEKASEDYVQTDAWICDTMGEFWKDSEKDLGQPAKNVFTILARLSNAYLSEHRELLQLREEMREQSYKREKKDRCSHSKKSKKGVAEASIEDFSDYEDPDDIALEPIDFYAFGVGYCTNKYSTFLFERKNIDNEISARCHQYRSDEGIVRYRSPVPYRQNVTVTFTNEEPFIYEVEILVDTYADDILNTELIYDYLSEHDIIYDEIPMPFSIIEQPFNQFDVQKIEGAEELCVGVRISHRFSFKNDVDEMSSTKMQYLFAITKRMQLCIDEAIQSATSK